VAEGEVRRIMDGKWDGFTWDLQAFVSTLAFTVGSHCVALSRGRCNLGLQTICWIEIENGGHGG
jgi:hypothetical protein